jgi:hypothetical protein
MNQRFMDGMSDFREQKRGNVRMDFGHRDDSACHGVWTRQMLFETTGNRVI